MGDAAVLRIGVPRLTDSAPVFVAEAEGFFAEEGLAVALAIEPSWANIADKLAAGVLDAAVMLPPLAIAMGLGLRQPGASLIVPVGLSLNGNSIVLAPELAAAIDRENEAMEAGRRLRALTAHCHLRLAVVHAWSTHDLLLRYWLRASGIDPDTDVAISTVPPPDMPDALAAGQIDGFCVGAPWGAVAAARGAGAILLHSAAIWRNHPEKCLAVRAGWADAHPARLQDLLRALIRAGAVCDDPSRSGAVAALLQETALFDVERPLIEAGLAGGAADGALAGGNPSVFSGQAANMPWKSHAAWFAGQMALRHATPQDMRARAEAMYRPDLFAEAARALGLPVPKAESKQEGGHHDAWLLPADSGDIGMQPDLFVDGAISPGPRPDG